MYCVGCSLTFRAFICASSCIECMLDARVVAYVSTNGSSVGAAAASVRPFWERPLDGGGALRFGKDSLYHTRLVIIISAPHWIGRPKKTTLAGAAAFVVVVPERGGRGCAAFCLCSLSPIDHATSPPTLSAEDSMLPLLSLAGLRACVCGAGQNSRRCVAGGRHAGGGPAYWQSLVPSAPGARPI